MRSGTKPRPDSSRKPLKRDWPEQKKPEHKKDEVFQSRPDEVGAEGEVDDLIDRPGWNSGKEFEYKGYGDQGAFGQPSGADHHPKNPAESSHSKPRKKR